MCGVKSENLEAKLEIPCRFPIISSETLSEYSFFLMKFECGKNDQFEQVTTFHRGLRSTEQKMAK